jgi:chemotaxis family two-component system sensor kinase Cph1
MSFSANLTNCDLEPIHIPGKIQGHGFLIVADKNYRIVCCSENIQEFLSATAVSLLQQPLGILEQHFGPNKPDGFLKQLLMLGAASDRIENFNPYVLDIQGSKYNLIISVSGTEYLLEFEPMISDLDADLFQSIGHALSEILTSPKLVPLLQRAVAQIKDIIGYERIMIYMFHPDGHGEVVAEEKSAELESLVGLHYPATDIPKQARELYKINHIRLISDVNTEPSPIIGAAGLTESPVDLSSSVLRAVSPIHIQYLKNMGVASSFSISIVCNNELWGLIACHNYTPRFINYKQRESAKLVGQVLASAITFRQNEEELLKKNRFNEAIVMLAKGLIRDEHIEKTLFDNPVTLLDAVEATGVALYYNKQWYSEGNTPDIRFLDELRNWLAENMEQQLFETHELPIIYPEALRQKDIASGVLVCTLSKELKEYMIWFRPETITTVDWAGNPEKPVVIADNGLLTITPRASFEIWKEMVQFTSLVWNIEDLRSALLIRDEIAFAVTRKAGEVRLLNEKLSEAYEELNAFSYTVSHDLKNPLTSIKSFGQLLKRNVSLNDTAQHMVDRILTSADKMQKLIEDVLRYSQTGINSMGMGPVNMSLLIDDLKQEFLAVYQHLELEIIVGDCIDIHGDQTMVMQVFSNLLSNAIKYAEKTASPIISIACQETDEGIEYSVADNGIGIKAADHENIFGLFKRSAEVEAYEGSGVGLSIVKKIMEKHLGKVWVETNLNQGATFYVTFAKPKV